MKKIFALLLIFVMLAVVGCDKSNEAPTNGSGTGDGTTEGFGFVYENETLIPGNSFSKEKLPEPESVYTVPSCAMEGTDNVYNYTVLEVTAFQDGAGERIYSIYLLDANTPTPEGLYLGDNLSRAIELYGMEYQQDGAQVTYQKGNTLLVLILQEENVTSIEYRLAN